MARILVTGSRDFANLELVYQVLYGLITYPNRKTDITEMYVGDARGVDRKAAQAWLKLTGKVPRIFRADWKKYGKSAGVRRNIEMVDELRKAGNGLVLVFWDGQSKGTEQCADYARSRGGVAVLRVIGFENIRGSIADLKLEPWKPELSPSNKREQK